MYDYKKHAEAMLEVESLVAYASNVCEGMQTANNQMGERQYNNTASGVFGLMAGALDKAYALMSEHEADFRRAHGIGYGEEEKRVADSANSAESLAIRIKQGKEIPIPLPPKASAKPATNRSEYDCLDGTVYQISKIDEALAVLEEAIQYPCTCVGSGNAVKLVSASVEILRRAVPKAESLMNEFFEMRGAVYASN